MHCTVHCTVHHMLHDVLLYSGHEYCSGACNTLEDATHPAYGCSLPRMRLQPPSHTVAASLAYGCSLACVRSQVRLWVWLCLQSSSTNCVYMYCVIPRYLAIRDAQAPRTRTRPALPLPLCLPRTRSEAAL